jgi:hypothetical protein
MVDEAQGKVATRKGQGLRRGSYFLSFRACAASRANINITIYL